MNPFKHNHDDACDPDAAVAEGYADDGDLQVITKTGVGTNCNFNVCLIERGGSRRDAPDVEHQNDQERFYSKKYISQTTDIASQVLFTPPEDGLYTLNIAAFTKVAGSGSMSATLTFVCSTSMSNVIAIIDVGTTGAWSTQGMGTYAMPVALIGQSPVLIATSGGPYTSGAFDLFFSAERLA